MNNNKLTLILKSLSNMERKYCTAFIQHHFSIKSEDVLRLWQVILKEEKKVKQRALTKEVIFEKLFPETTYSDIKLRNLMRKLTRVLEDFLIYKEYENNPLDKSILLNTIYRKRNIYSLFEKSKNKIRKTLEEQPKRGSYYFLENYMLLKQFYLHQGTEKNAASASNLQDAFQHLNHFFSNEKLHIKIELLNQERILGNPFDKDFFESSQHSAISTNLLKTVAELIQTQDPETYKKAKKSFTKHLEYLSDDDRNIIYPALLNYVIGKSLTNESQFLEETFQLYKSGLNAGLLISDEKITGSTYFNITTTAAQLKEFEWAKNFLKEYTPFLSGIYKKDFEIIAQAYLYFYQKEFTQTIKQLSNYEFNYPLLNLNAKTLSCRTLYELTLQDKSYYETTNNQILALEKYIKRNNNISLSKKAAYLNLSNALSKLLKATNTLFAKEQSKKKLREEIINYPAVISRSWLLKKVSREK